MRPIRFSKARMFTSLSHLEGATLTGNDGDIGHLREALFDESSWTFRYLVVETGPWLRGHALLLPMQALQQPIAPSRDLHADFSQHQLRAGPALDPREPLSRWDERRLLRHYHLPVYWLEGAASASGSQLRSSDELQGCEIVADGRGLGRVQDFVFDNDSWVLRYLMVDTSAWWRGGRRVLIALSWIEQMDRVARRIHVSLSRDQVRESPAFEDVASIHRDYEQRLHQGYGRAGYWA